MTHFENQRSVILNEIHLLQCNIIKYYFEICSQVLCLTQLLFNIIHIEINYNIISKENLKNKNLL